MPRRRHDSLSKDLLSLWLAPLGRVESPRRVHGEERQIDVVLVAAHEQPAARVYRRHLGLLGRMARGVAALEPFRNPCTAREMRSCLVKLVELHEEQVRRARRGRRRMTEVPLPHLWVVTPTCSAALLAGFGARPRADLPAGFFGLPDELGTTVVVTSLLVETPATLWLRLLGRGEVQRRALDELNGLPENHPLRAPTAHRVLRWRREAEQRPSLTEADRELLMNTERWVTQWEQGLLRKGKAEGKAEGKAQAVLAVLEARGLTVTAAQRARVLGCADLATLEGWVRQAATAKATADLFAAPKRAPKTRR